MILFFPASVNTYYSTRRHTVLGSEGAPRGRGEGGAGEDGEEGMQINKRRSRKNTAGTSIVVLADNFLNVQGRSRFRKDIAGE
jgi:hypothetical protein